MTKVYGDFDQKMLDNEYLISRTVPNLDPFIADYVKFSADARANLECWEDVSCGDHMDQLIDVFPAEGKDGKAAPIFIFIHGGYWRMLSHKESSFMAENMVANGIAVVAVNYSLAPDASLDTIVRQCREAVGWTWRNAADFCGDPDRIFVCGSSAGGHLTGMMVAGGWHEDLGVPEDIIKGAVPLSGLHDLEPMRHSCVNEWVKLDKVSARRNSPVHHLPEAECPLILAYGASETFEFKRQSALLGEAWRAKGWQSEIFEHPDRNHFDIVFDLRDFDSLLGRKVRDMIV